jgi:hypothetical protein
MPTRRRDEGNDNVLFEMPFGFAVFLLDEIRLYFCSASIMLPSEY